MTKIQFTKDKCWLCNGTGASNPDAEHSMDYRDYLPCIACHGTGFTPRKVEPIALKKEK